MRIEQSGLSYSPLRQPQRPEAGQAPSFDRIAEAAKTAKSAPTQKMQGAGAAQAASLSGPVAQPLSQYLSIEEKQMLGALFPSSNGSFGVRAYQQGQQPGMNMAVRGQGLDMTS